MTLKTAPRWCVTYRSALGREPPATLTIESDSITDALKTAQMMLFEMGGLWKITGISAEEPEDTPPASSAAAA